MKKVFNTPGYILPALLFCFLVFSACRKEVSKQQKKEEEISATVRNASNVRQVNRIYVSGVSELYAAVNDPGNVGNMIVLAPGVYILSASYPNAGRLELLENMGLQGQPGNQEEVIIDESSLPAASFVIPSVRTGGIRMGSGTNNIEWLTIKGGTVSANAFSVIDTDLPSTETYIGIFHVKIIGNGSSVGIDIRNRRPEQAGRKIYAELKNNDVSGVTTFLGPGIEIQNANSASGSYINVNLAGNYLHGNRVGVGAFNNGANSSVTNSSIEITSQADKIEENGIGLFLGGGLSQVASAFGSDNTTSFEAHGSSIRNNNPVPMPPALLPNVIGYVPCGIYTFGGISTSAGGNNKSSNNTLTVRLWGCDISDNNSPDINAFGAWCQTSALLAGVNNLVEIHLYGNSNNAMVEATSSIPVEPAGTNVVNIFR